MTHHTTYRMAFSTMALDGKIPNGDPVWKTFNASFVNDEYNPHLMALLIDEGRAFTTQHANGWRQNSHFVCGQHLGVDFDTLSVDQAMSDPLVERYAAIVYATPSSTPENPRCRAVFLLDKPIFQAVNYTRAAVALLSSFGGKADAQCKDPARFFYGSAGSMPICRPLEWPLQNVIKMIEQYEAMQQKAQPKHRRPSEVFLRSTDAQDAQRLLQRLSPSRADDYNDWVTVGMALAAALGSEGLPLWIQWSAQSAKFDAGACEAKWRSFDGSGVTMASVAHMAKQDSP